MLLLVNAGVFINKKEVACQGIIVPDFDSFRQKTQWLWGCKKTQGTTKRPQNQPTPLHLLTHPGCETVKVRWLSDTRATALFPPRFQAMTSTGLLLPMTFRDKVWVNGWWPKQKRLFCKVAANRSMRKHPPGNNTNPPINSMSHAVFRRKLF